MIKFNFERYQKILPWLKYGLIILLGIFLMGFFGLRPADKPKPVAPIPAAAPPVAAKYADFHLEIPSLNIVAPVIPDVDGNNKKEYFKALESGLAHYQNTAKPGESGNIFIFGHSSYYAWKPGDYKEVFRSLEDIKTGDEIDLWWQNKKYQYTIESTKVVDPDDVSVLAPTPTEQLTLMTCVPLGTAEKRLIVVAKPRL